MADFDRALRMILRDHQCYYLRPADGSHELWFSPINNRKFVVPHHIKSRHTANGALKQAGIGKRL